MGEENNKWLIDWIKADMKDLTEMIKDRAIEYTYGELADTDWLFDVAIDHEEFQNWTETDMENHNWDLSRWYVLKEILKKIEDKNDNRESNTENG